MTSPAARRHSRLRFEDAVSATDPVNEQAMLRDAGFGGRDGQSDERRLLIQPIGAQLELAPCGREPRLGAGHSQRLLELERFRPQVDLEERRNNDGAEQ